MADKLIGGLFRRARNRQERRYASTPAQVGRLMRLFRGTIDALADAVEEGSDPIDAIDEAVGWATLVRARPDVSRIADTAVEDPLVAADDQYATLRKFAPLLIEALEFRSLQGSARTVKALDLLRDLNRSASATYRGTRPCRSVKNGGSSSWNLTARSTAAFTRPQLWHTSATSSEAATYGWIARPRTGALTAI